MVVVPNSVDVLLYPSVNWSLNIYSLQEKKIWIMPHKMYCMAPTLNPPTKKYNPFMRIIRFDKHERQVWKYDMGCVILLPWVKKWLFHQQKFFESLY
jgi:hypothetical protein